MPICRRFRWPNKARALKSPRLNLKIFKICVVRMRRVSAILAILLPARSAQRNFKFYKAISAKFHSWRERCGAKPRLEGNEVKFNAANNRDRFEWFLKFQRRGASLLYLTPKKFASKFNSFGSSCAKFYFTNLAPWRKWWIICIKAPWAFINFSR